MSPINTLQRRRCNRLLTNQSPRSPRLFIATIRPWCGALALRAARVSSISHASTNTGYPLDQALEWDCVPACSSCYVVSLLETGRPIWISGMRGEPKHGSGAFDGEYRWFLFRNQPLRDEVGTIVKWYGSGPTSMPHRQKCSAPERSFHLACASIEPTGTFGWRIATGESYVVIETFRFFGYDEGSSVTSIGF